MDDPLLFAGSASRDLAGAVARELDVQVCGAASERYPGGELHVELQQDVAGGNVFLVQSTAEPIERNLLEIALIADAARRAGALRCSALIPYLGYNRQDRRSGHAVPIGAKVVARILDTAAMERIVLVDLHDPATEGYFATPVAHLTAESLLLERLGPVDARSVVVSPDLGAAKLARRYASKLSLPVAVVQKERLTGADVTGHGVSGDVRDRHPIVVDDMITTGGTMVAALQQLTAAGAAGPATAVAAHGVFEPGSLDQLEAAGIQRLIVTDSVAPAAELPAWVEVVSLGPLLAEAVRRLHAGRSLASLLSPA